MANIIDANNHHHGEAGTLDAGKYVTKGLSEIPGAGNALTRTRASIEQLRADSRLALEYQVKADHPTAVSATVRDGSLVAVTLADGTTVDSFPTAGDDPDLAHLSVVGLTDPSIEIPLDQTVPVSAYTNRVTATFQFQQSDDGDDLWNVGSETADITDILASMESAKLNLDEPSYMHEDYDLRDEIYWAAEKAGLITPPEGCAFDVDINSDEFEAFAAERLELEADGSGQGACILTGEPGENPDDCTTHDHEE